MWPLCTFSLSHPTRVRAYGVKRSLLTDGEGIPLALVVDGANRHDIKLLLATADGIVIARPQPTAEEPQHICLDAGYDAAWVREAVQARGYQHHIRSRGEETTEKARVPGAKARRWVVERTHSWPGSSRRLLIRWEKKVSNYLAFLSLACAQLIAASVFRFSEVFG